MMKPRTPVTALLELSRRCKRSGMPFSVVTDNLHSDFTHYIPEMQKEYNRVKVRK